MPKDKEEKIKDKKTKAETEDALELTDVESTAEAELDAKTEGEALEVATIEQPAVEDLSPQAEDTVFATQETEEDIETDKTVTVQPVKFASFEDLGQTQGEINKNLDILLDIKLQLTVELGRTELPIKKVLELTRGSIIELEKVAGEPVELYANGKLIAHGEVVVIEDNFGLRITSITEPDERLKGI